ncbi:MAG: hypothetical protein E7D58_09975 [Haemophilus parainfluenzae]|nr:hypothetical protein [Haemophilus parainfluenzae]MDU2383000.1 hypothetical protein [Haemophilus parainfluenzae]
MRRINYTIIFLFTLIFSLGSYGSDYCLFKEIPYENNFSIKIFILSKECGFDNNSDSVVKLFNGDKVIKESKYILPKIDVNKDYIFEGERDLRVNAGYLELEIAKPNRAMSDAYSFIFKFKINKEKISFFDYEISDLCYIPNESLCPRRDKIREDKMLHEIIRTKLIGIDLFDFITLDAYDKIYAYWQKDGRGSKISVDKAYLYKKIGDITNMYLIKNDYVLILDEFLDKDKSKWYLINYKGKKELNMWIKADSVDLN